MPNNSSFAFAAPDPIEQGVPGGGSNFRGPQLVGGQSTGQNLSPGAQNPVNFGGQVGGFFDKLMQPYVEQKAKEQYIKGMTDQMYAEAGHEVHTDGFLSKIFGPTAYEEGAIFYQAQQRVAEVQKNWTANEDTLKKLAPNDVAKEWSRALDQAKTGNQFVDASIENSMLEASGPMLQSVAKAQYKWQQDTVVKNQQAAWSSAADAYQQVSASFAATASPTDEQVQGYELATHNFLTGYKIPQGQEEASYKKSITDSFRAVVQSGNGHAATALRNAGVLDVIDEKDRVSLEDAYQRYGQKAINSAASNHASDIDAIEGEIKQGKAFTTEVQPAMAKLNEVMKRETGFDTDFYDVNDEKAASSSIWGAVKSAYDKQEERAYQVERDNANFQRQQAVEEAKVAAKAKLADAAWASANPAGAMVAGAVPESDLQAAAYRSYVTGDMANLVKGFKSGISSNAIKGAITNSISSSVYTGYTPEFEGVNTQFNNLMQADTATAKEYFGKNFPAMLQYNKLISGGASKTNAFAQAFGDDVQYQANGTQVGAAKKWVTDWVDENAQPGRFSRIFAGEEKLNTSGASALSNLLAREVAVDSNNAGADMSKEVLMRTALNRVRANGQFEKYGEFGWTNKPGTKPLSMLMGMQPQEAGPVISSEINKRLEATGHKPRSLLNEATFGMLGRQDDEYAIHRGTYDGKDTLFVIPTDDAEGLMYDKAIRITLPELQAAGKAYRTKQVTDPNSVADPKAVPPQGLKFHT